MNANEKLKNIYLEEIGWPRLYVDLDNPNYVRWLEKRLLNVPEGRSDNGAESYPKLSEVRSIVESLRVYDHDVSPENAKSAKAAIDGYNKALDHVLQELNKHFR